jgi:E3 ubiquitin-protein ligase synoviolin
VQQLGIQQGNQAPGVVPAPLPVQDQPALGQAGRQQRIQSIATHISQAGELLQREVQALQNSQQELTTLTLLLTELQRVQQRAENQVDPSAIFPAQAAVPNIALPAGFQSGHQVAVHNPLASLPGVPPFSALPPRISTPFVARHGTASNATAIPAGSPDLPEGVVIPQGWSLMPLQRLDGNASSNTPMPPTPQSMAQQQPQPQPTATTSPPPPNGENALDGSNAGQSSTSSTGVNTNVGNDAQSTGATSPTAASASTPAPAPASRPVEPTPVVSPSPVLPNWGGPAQLFSNGPRLDPAEGAAPPLSQPQASGPTSAEQEADDSSSAESDDTSPEQSAPASAPASEKGKAKAATVEDDDDSASD